MNEMERDYRARMLGYLDDDDNDSCIESSQVDSASECEIDIPRLWCWSEILSGFGCKWEGRTIALPLMWRWSMATWRMGLWWSVHSLHILEHV